VGERSDKDDYIRVSEVPCSWEDFGSDRTTSVSMKARWWVVAATADELRFYIGERPWDMVTSTRLRQPEQVGLATSLSLSLSMARMIMISRLKCRTTSPAY
jgi:hypothetical protein